MNAPPHVDRPNMTDAEWQARCDLAALYRITDLFGWTDTIDTHMTVRIPGEPKCFLINNYGDLFHEITASSLVKMDIDGKVYSDEGKFNAAGFTIHSGVYKAKPDANCVMHTHTRAGAGARVGVHDAVGVGLGLVDATVDGEARGVELAFVGVDLAVDVHLHQARGGDLVEQVAVIVDQKALGLARDAHRHVGV